jgi:ABC-2 type transport system ATP-binding protein
VSEPAIVARDLSKRFGDRVAFEGLSFDVAVGEVFGFLGPNGAGKTTTVRVLATLLAPTSGSAVVAGVPVDPQHDVEVRRRISVMTETPGLYSKLSVFENLEFFCGLYEVPRADVRRRIMEVLAAVDMAGRVGDLAGGLSKGLRQRVGLARALLNEPHVLFLDEPTSGLDPVAAREVRELIEGLRSRGVTVFLTTHRLDEAERLCDRIAILNTTLRTIGRPEDLRRQLFSAALEVKVAAPLADPSAIFDSAPGVKRWSARDGSYTVEVDDAAAAAPSIARSLVAAGADVLRIAEERHSLEDVYLEFIDEDVEVRP